MSTTKAKISGVKKRDPTGNTGIRRTRVTRDKSAATHRVSKAVRAVLESLHGITMREWLSREDLFFPYMLGASDSWFGWFCLLIAFCGEPLINDRELAKYKELVGRDYVEGVEPDEVFICTPRRTGKTAAISILTTFQALTKNYSSRLRPGEHPRCVLVAKGIEEAKELLNYVKGYFTDIKLFQGLEVGSTSTSLRIANGVHVQVKAGAFRAVRGSSIIFAACDEEAFWMDRGANPAAELLSAIYPSLKNLGGKIFHISSPYAKVGPMYEASLKYSDGHIPKILWVHVKDGAALNPPIFTPENLEIERIRDPANFAREWMAEFDQGYDQFIDRDLVQSLVVKGRVELPPIAGVEYKCFVDPAGGGQDEYTCCISHVEYLDGKYDVEHQLFVIDVLRGRRGRSDSITREYAQLMKQYRITECTGDRYGGDYPKNAMEREGITYIASEKHRSDIYAEVLPILHQKRCELLDDRICVAQFAELQRSTTSVGRDRIVHPMSQGATDDRANSCAGSIWLWSGEEINEFAALAKRWGFGPGTVPEGNKSKRNSAEILVDLAAADNARNAGDHGRNVGDDDMRRRLQLVGATDAASPNGTIFNNPDW